MINQEVLEKMKEQYEKAKILAKQSWEDGDHEGDVNEQYYFEKGMKSLEEVQVMAEKKELLRKVAFQLLEREN